MSSSGRDPKSATNVIITSDSQSQEPGATSAPSLPKNKPAYTTELYPEGLPTHRDCVMEIDPDAVKSPALRRIIEEIQWEKAGGEMVETLEHTVMYNRVHNRHNRSVNGRGGYNRVHNRHNRGR